MTLEFAKLLKEQGFTGKCTKRFTPRFQISSKTFMCPIVDHVLEEANILTNWNHFDDYYSSPSMNDVTNWLKEKGLDLT